MRGGRKAQLEEIDQRRLLRHRLEPPHLADVAGIRVLDVAVMHEERAGPAAIAASIDPFRKLGHGPELLSLVAGRHPCGPPAREGRLPRAPPRPRWPSA